MQLTFLGKETSGGQSPTLYATDRWTYVVQGWIVTDPVILSLLKLSDDETVVEVPARLMAHLTKDGLAGEVINHEGYSRRRNLIGDSACSERVTVRFFGRIGLPHSIQRNGP